MEKSDDGKFNEVSENIQADGFLLANCNMHIDN